MRRLLIMLLFIPAQVFAQTVPQREKLDTKSCYELAIREYIRSHPECPGTSAFGKIIFVKKQGFTGNLKDTINGIMVRYIDPATDIDTIARYIRKKQKLPLLDIYMMMSRETNAFIWVMPMEMRFSPSKKHLDEPEYKNTLCEYVFDYTPERNSYYFFKEAACKKAE